MAGEAFAYTIEGCGCVLTRSKSTIITSSDVYTTSEGWARTRLLFSTRLTVHFDKEII